MNFLRFYEGAVPGKKKRKPDTAEKETAEKETYCMKKLRISQSSKEI
jgi:hypothetical protein